MVVHRKRKVRKYRGKTTHGGGHRKKRRGAGSRGGKGNAGTGKRAGHKKAGMKYVHLGSHGFLPRRSESVSAKVINVGDLTPPIISKWTQEGKATKEGSYLLINLTQLGYGKLLGTGTAHAKLKLVVSQWSSQAEEKVKAAGGELLHDVSSSA